MTSLEDRAKAGTDDWFLAEESVGVYRLLDDETVDADEVGDEYPKHGEFLPVSQVHVVDDDIEAAGGTVYVECPAGLAMALLDIGVGSGDEFAIRSVQKGPGGRWQFEAHRVREPGDLL